MLVGIDPGHGGKDPGAVGLYGLTEKSVVLDIAIKLDQLLRRKNLKTLLTRHKDQFISLSERTKLLNSQNTNITISIHCNASTNRSASYMSTYIYGTGSKAEQLAKVVQQALVETTGWRNGGVRFANLHMVRETKMPAILLELGFISNIKQEELLGEECLRFKLAHAIATGIINYRAVYEKET